MNSELVIGKMLRWSQLNSVISVWRKPELDLQYSTHVWFFFLFILYGYWQCCKIQEQFTKSKYSHLSYIDNKTPEKNDVMEDLRCLGCCFQKTEQRTVVLIEINKSIIFKLWFSPEIFSNLDLVNYITKDYGTLIPLFLWDCVFIGIDCIDYFCTAL